MIKKPVKIIVNTTQTLSDGSTQTYNQTFEGFWYVKGDVQYFHYQENNESGLGNTQTTLKVAQNDITLIRQGEINMRHVYQLDKQFSGQYQTPYGNLGFWIETEKMDHFIGDDEARICIEYTMEMEGEKSRMNLQIKVKTISKD
ncbi:hypothetical protein DNHGIG_13300 [Collibacillus ludicampi]|jgi:uncharacterized beta-barrel protein YwiB (DUF1934 family)|uniref:DUF1934 domain-containing protein n=1 Tax=Collibacillus ludicampi TaxID=2771369 RepID=A0AAV4LDE1_9BACL|nr:DUF1934 domain-containing protein [Collibacillus ludicampi]GIM45781.1 hypothetical protein DNHGIG_13300 [Collibacillus ludicampi]